jgi:Subtilase family
MHRSDHRTTHARRWAVFAVLGLVASTLSLISTTAAAATTTATTGAAARSTGAEPAEADRASQGPRVVTLVTGDRVAVTRLPDGRTTARLLPGSPHFGEPMQTVSLAGELYVRPRGMSPAAAERLDMSMFNVTRLARLAADGGSVPVDVTFAPGAKPHDLPGVDVATGTARTTASDRTVADGAYEPTTSSTGSWRDVSSVALAGSDASDPERYAADDYELWTLTVNTRNRAGEPADCPFVAVTNVDDGRLFNFGDFCAAEGLTKLSVPAGNYAVIAGIDEYEPECCTGSIVADHEVEVSADTEVTVTGSEATTRARLPKVPGAKPVEGTLNYIRSAEGPGSFTFGYGFGPGFPVYVQPSGVPTVGDLRSGVRATLRIPHAKRPATLVESYDWQRGVPEKMAYQHPLSDFATVKATYYSDGRKRDSFYWAGSAAFMPGQPSDFYSLWPTRAPMTRMERYLGDPAVTWYPGTDAGVWNSMSARGRRYQASHHHAEAWFRGPIHPGVGHPVQTPPTGPRCPACRSGDVIRLDMSPATETYFDHYGFNWRGNPWALRRGDDFVARGKGAPWGEFDVPAGTARYRLAVRHRMAKPFQMSTGSETVWGFTSSTGEAVLPLLVPRYHLPVDVMNRMPAGRTSFRMAIPKLGRDTVHILKPTVKVSYNGGKTWKRATVVRRGPAVFRVRVVNPTPGDNPRYGSLRVFAKDRAGNTVSETIRRAWGVRGGRSAGGTDGTGPSPSAVPRRPCGQPDRQMFHCLTVVEAYGQAAMEARSDPAGYGARELQDAYNLTSGGVSGQTVAIVVAGDYPTAAKDLNVYRQQFGLPPCTVDSGCFTKLNQKGEEGNYPRPDRGWALEAALDLQMASAACPSCKIVLVEANSPYFGPMAKAVDTAAGVADVVSHSYGSYEFNGVQELAQHYDVEGVPMTVSTGNWGYEPANFPASVPSVIAVGGTALRHADNDRGWTENAWQYGNSGCSAYFDKPEWQTDPACHMRTAADIAAVAAPNTGVAVYDSFGYSGQKGWFVLGGTSTAAPLVAGMIAAAGDADDYTGADLYAHAAAGTGLYDVTTGSNEWFDCRGSYMCNAKPGYDAPTGHGTPNGLEAFTDVTP